MFMIINNCSTHHLLTMHTCVIQISYRRIQAGQYLDKVLLLPPPLHHYQALLRHRAINAATAATTAISAKAMAKAVWQQHDAGDCGGGFVAKFIRTFVAESSSALDELSARSV